MYDAYGKEGVFASAGGGGSPGGGGGGSGPWPQGFSGQGGMPNFGGSQGGPGGSTFFSFGGGDGGGMGANGDFTDPRELFDGLFGEGGGGGGGGGASSLFGSLFKSSLFDDLPGMHGMGGEGAGGGGSEGGRRGSSPRSPQGRRPSARPPVEKEFWCSLRELYEGCEKKMKVTDAVTDPRTGQSQRVSRVYRIVVKPGWKEGTRVTFPATSEGLRSICFVLRQRRHRFLSRDGDCLVYECRLTEDQAQRGVRVKVPMLSKEDSPIELTTKGQEIYDGKEMLLPGLGMPGKGGGKGGRGSFKIKFRLKERLGKAFAA